MPAISQPLSNSQATAKKTVNLLHPCCSGCSSAAEVHWTLAAEVHWTLAGLRRDGIQRGAHRAGDARPIPSVHEKRTRVFNWVSIRR